MEPTEYNRRAWDEIHRRRADAMAGQLGIPPAVRERLPDVKGKHVLHLQCATGESTAELADLGALVTGVDQASLWREDYFDESPIVDVGWQHFYLPGEPAQEQKYGRVWRLGQIVTAVAGAGLAIRSLEEFSTIYETYWREKDPRVPGQFVLIAAKPS